MSEKTLLVELEKDKKKIVEKKLALQREEAEKKKFKQKEEKDNKKYTNVFSSKSFKNLAQPDLIKAKEEDSLKEEVCAEKESLSEEQELAKVESKVSMTIEKPNYDYIETLTDSQREKVFKIEKQQEVKPKQKASKLKAIVLSIVFAIFGVWGIVNIAQIDSVSSQITQASQSYYLNLPKYLSKLAKLDATSAENMNNLFETIPDEDMSPSEIIEKSNWFDRFCNFIAGLFGG